VVHAQHAEIHHVKRAAIGSEPDGKGTLQSAAALSRCRRVLAAFVDGKLFDHARVHVDANDLKPNRMENFSDAGRLVAKQRHECIAAMTEAIAAGEVDAVR
jgi:hypothetical protein